MEFHTLPLPIQVINYDVGTKRNNNNNNNNNTSNGIPNCNTILWHRTTNLLTTAYRENNIGR